MLIQFQDLREKHFFYIEANDVKSVEGFIDPIENCNTAFIRCYTGDNYIVFGFSKHLIQKINSARGK